MRVLLNIYIYIYLFFKCTYIECMCRGLCSLCISWWVSRLVPFTLHFNACTFLLYIYLHQCDTIRVTYTNTIECTRVYNVLLDLLICVLCFLAPLHFFYCFFLYFLMASLSHPWVWNYTVGVTWWCDQQPLPSLILKMLFCWVTVASGVAWMTGIYTILVLSLDF